jgi:glutaredoxin
VRGPERPGRPLRIVAVALVVALGLARTARGEPTVHVFTRAGCPHCEAAEAFLVVLRAERPGLVVERHDVVRDPAARQWLLELVAAHGQRNAAVPAFLIGDTLLIGFRSAETTGAALRAALDAGSSPNLHVPILGTLEPERLGLTVFTIALGLIDGFNPCAMWVLLFVLALLVNLHDRLRMLLIGGTFVVVSGAAYFAFMVAWLNVFLLVGLARWVEALLGVVALGMGAVHVKDFVALRRGPSLSIPESVKPTIYARVRRVLTARSLGTAMAATVVLAVLVNVVELLCTAGLPAVYTRVLTLHELPAWRYYAYIGLYNVAYVFDDAIMVGVAAVTLSRRKLGERGGRALKLVSGIVMLVLGALLLLRPEWLR